MRRSATCLSLTALALTFIASAAFAGPTDIVPRGDIAYDILGSFAASGRLPGKTLGDFFRGDRLYTRAEIAGFIQQVRDEIDAGTIELPASVQAQLQTLEIKFEPELRYLSDLPRFKVEQKKRTGGFTGMIKIRGGAEPISGDVVARFTGTLPLTQKGYLALSGGSYRNEWYDLNAIDRDGYPAFETAIARLNGRALDVSIGRMPMRWGPGFAGAMLLSDEGPSIPMIQIEKGFKLPGSIGRHLGRIYFTQFAGEIYEDEVPAGSPNRFWFTSGTRRHILGRRLETQGTGRWQFSLAESLKATRLPDALYSMVLPLYFYQDTWTKYPGDDEVLIGFLAKNPYPNTAWANYLVDGNVTYQLNGQGAFAYLDYLIDDIKAPTGLNNGNDTPRKAGVQLGVYYPNLSGGRYGVRAEFATIDKNVYANDSLSVTWENLGAPLGHAAGGNANVFFGRVDANLPGRLKISAEGHLRRRKDDSQDAPESDRFSLFGHYNLRNDLFVGGRFDYTRNAYPGTSDKTNTYAEVSLGLGF